MTTKELMLGNYVEMFIKDFGFHDEMVDLNLLSQIDFHNDQEFDNDDIYFVPIELTEKWLLDFGFEKIYNDCYIYNTIILNNKFELMDIDINVKCKYVHQLQNLYFTLTANHLRLVEPK